MANSEQRASGWARVACSQGLARRAGVMWSRLDGTKQVAAYELTPEGHVLAEYNRSREVIARGQAEEMQRRAQTAKRALAEIRRAYERGDRKRVESLLTQHTGFGLGPVKGDLFR